MKTVPTVRLADTADGAALPDLPEEIALAMADIAGAAREGLMVMSVAAGMAVMAAMFDAEIAQGCGPKGRDDAGRPAVRHGTGTGSVTLGGRRVRVDRPRARTVDGHEVPLGSYAHFAAEDLLSWAPGVLSVLNGLFCRGDDLDGEFQGGEQVDEFVEFEFVDVGLE